MDPSSGRPASPVIAGRRVVIRFLVTSIWIAAAQPHVRAQPAAAEPPNAVFTTWVKLCNKGPDPNSKRVCVIVKDGRIESGQLIAGVAVIEMDGEPRKLVRVAVPYGANLAHGTRMTIDQGAPSTAQFVTCRPPIVPPGVCIADYVVNADMINRMKEGQRLAVQAIHTTNEPKLDRMGSSVELTSWQFELKDFGTAYDGPPTDLKAFEKQKSWWKYRPVAAGRKLQEKIKDDTLQPHLRPNR